MASAESTKSRLPIRCPRCGYDQRGMISQWREQCPLQGTCTECGLEFRWVEVFRPELFEPPWCIEFAPRKRNCPRAAGETLLRSFWPWGFWSRVSMGMRVRFKRLAIYGIILLMLVALPYVAVQSYAGIFVRHQVEKEMQQWPQAAAAQLQSFDAWLQSPQMIGLRERLSDETRAATLQYWNAQRQRLLQQANAPPPTVELSYAWAVSEAVFKPLSSFTRGQIVNSTGLVWGAYPAPAELYEAIERYETGVGLNGSGFPTGLPATGGVRWSLFILTVVGVMRPMLFWLFVLLLMPLSLALLPVSRRRSKVRWSHIGRAGIYTLWIPVVVWLLCTICIFIHAYFGAGSIFGRMPMMFAVIAFPVLIIGSWWAVIGRYLRIRHAPVSTLLLLVVCVLLVASAAFWGDQLLFGGEYFIGSG